MLGLLLTSRYKMVCISSCYCLDSMVIESQWGRDFPHQTRQNLGDKPSSYTNRTGSVTVVKQLARSLYHPSPSNTEVKEKVELYTYPSFL